MDMRGEILQELGSFFLLHNYLPHFCSARIGGSAVCYAQIKVAATESHHLNGG